MNFIRKKNYNDYTNIILRMILAESCRQVYNIKNKK